MLNEATRLAGGPLELQAIGHDTDSYSAYLITDLTSDLTVAGTPRGGGPTFSEPGTGYKFSGYRYPQLCTSQLISLPTEKKVF